MMATAPSEFLIRLQRGITGGFAPPTPSAVHSLTRSSNNPGVILVSSLSRADGTPDLAPHPPKELNADAQSGLIDELHDILKSIPVEKPPGSQDIYGLDTSIAFLSADLEWYNGGPEGCGEGPSFVQAAPADKEKFKRAVAIIEELTGS